MSDVVIVGGGIIGCSLAIELAERGASVLLIEEHQPGTGATGASAGMVAPQYEAEPDSPLFELRIESRRAFPEFVERLERLGSWAVDFRRDGMLVANRTGTEEDSGRAAAERQRGEGLRAEILDPSEAGEIHEEVSAEIPSWLWLPDEGQVNAQLLAVALGSAAKRSGVALRRGSRVTGIRARSGRVIGVQTETDDNLDAGAVVLSAGAWSGLVDGVPRALPVRPMRGQMLRLRPERPVPWPLVASHGGHYVVPRNNGMVLSGSTMEDRGFEQEVTERGAREIAAHASDLVPSLADATVIERWAGLRPVTLDGLPVLGPEPRLEGLSYATGHGRNGILLAPITARIVADLVLHGESSLPWEPCSPSRLPPPDADASERASTEARSDGYRPGRER